jgi:hypothetical protein
MVSSAHCPTSPKSATAASRPLLNRLLGVKSGDTIANSWVSGKFADCRRVFLRLAHQDRGNLLGLKLQ